jgi:carbon-monoxide dehydrogenase large subunit
MSEFTVIGKSVTRTVDGIRKVTGSALYGTDLKFQGMLYGKVLRSPFPHAKILNVDTTRAERLIGVKAVVTGKDFVGRYGTLIQDQPFYCFDKVNYVGDPVAGVAAIDLDTAQEALELIKVDYQELRAVFDPLEAMEPNAPLVHDDLGTYWHSPAVFPVIGTNICNHFKLRKGDIDEGFAKSDFISEDTFTTQMAQHCHLEPHVSIAKVDHSGEITIWTSTQHPYSCRRELARSLKISQNQIRIIVPFVGGGFGGKVYLKVEPLCVILAMKVKNNRFVKIELTREEEFYATSGVRHPTIIQIKTGVDKKGILKARKIKLVFGTGAYADAGPVITRSVGMSANGPYTIPNLCVDAYCVYTNNPIGVAFRGFGFPQLTWAIDSQMDILAEGIGMDPVEIRLKNALDEGSLSATGQILHSVGIKECIRKAAEGIGWGGKTVKNRGKGIGVMHKQTLTPSTSSASVKLDEDGTLEVLSSTVDMGQGSNTVLAQIVAEELGVNFKDVKIVHPDTDVTPYDHGTSSSRSTFHMGNAVREAAADVKKKLFHLAAKQLKADPEDLAARNGIIFVKETPERQIPISQVDMGGKYMGKGAPIIGSGTFSVPEATPLDPETGQGTFSSLFWSYAAQTAEVEVDTTTGKVEVLKIVAAHDTGRVINPLKASQQIQGGVVMGVGYTLLEELIVQEGKPLNPNLRDYRIPTSLDAPEISPIFIEDPHERGPYGAKGIGEPALSATPAAIGNAIYDAIGIRIKDLPITPEKILKALKEKGVKKA